jgi:hypothetical protein
MTPEENLEALRFPIGRFTVDPNVTASKRRLWIGHLAALPANLRSALGGLGESRLDRRYRPGGWTARQVVHHLADEHVNAFAYFKMALTEDEPVVKTYDEPRWAETEDASAAPVELSLNLLAGLHARWVVLLQSLDDEGFGRAYVHRRGRVSVDDGIQLYAWHGLHHTAHIVGLREREGW